MSRPLRSRLTQIDPVLRDAVVAGLLLVVMLLDAAGKSPEPGQRRGDVLAYLLVIALTAPYVVHRRRPLLALVVVVTSFTLFSARQYASYPGLALFLILFGVAAHTDRRRSLLALGLAVVAMIIGLSVQPAGIVQSSDRMSSLLAVAVAWLVGENHRARRARWRALEERASSREREREQSERRAIVDERLRIARDLHDIVAHSMSVVAVQAGLGQHILDQDPEGARRAMSNAEVSSRAALVEMRHLLGVLREDDDAAAATRAPTPGIATLNGLVKQVRDAGLGVTLDVDHALPPLPASIDVTVFRIVQEALTNVMKHGGPVAFVSIRAAADGLRIEVADDGRTTPSNPSSTGRGLVGMRERVALYRGDFSAASRPGGGFRVTARLPFDEPRDAADAVTATGVRS